MILEAYLEWWVGIVDPRVKRAAGGLPVDPDVYAMAQRVGLVERFHLNGSGTHPKTRDGHEI